jgi:hypothetical protein
VTTAHPDELLAEFLDGTLSDDDRVRVAAHLTECARCREDIALAREARGALASLPELEAPPGIGLAVRRRAGTRSAPSPVWRVVAPIAAAAVLLVGAIVVLGQLTGGEEESPAAGGGVAEAPAGPEPAPMEGAEGADEASLRLARAPTFTESDTNYAAADLSRVARDLRDRVRQELDSGFATTATAYYRAFDAAALPARLRDIYQCVVAEVPPEQLIVPFTIEAASFEGEPAYLASFLQGPAPDQPYDRILIWVVGREDCELRSLASQRL